MVIYAEVIPNRAIQGSGLHGKSSTHPRSPLPAPDALSIGLPVWLARGCCCMARARFPGRREESAWGGKRGAGRLQLWRAP